VSAVQTPKIEKWLEGFEKIKAPTRAHPRRKYDDNLVAFIDVLGMTELVREKGHNPEGILTTMGEIQRYVVTECEKLAAANKKISYIQIGDGFVIVTSLGLINKICELLSTVQWRTLVYSRMLVRGVLTAGEIVVAGNLFIGPALIEAYKLERENAIYPRIIYMNEIENHISTSIIKFGCVVEDQDKIKYLDFIKYYREINSLSPKQMDELLEKQGTKEILRSEFERLTKDASSENTRKAQKYGWLISKLASHGIKILT
jgi:hypothetical protein